MAEVPGSLNPHQRQRALETMSQQTLDVLVIGGGVTGVGCALDAASRGLKVGLVEQRDIASGTSSRSSKLLHGGLRYLETREFSLVREALRERSLHTTALAPHLVRPVSFLLPLPGRWWNRLYYGAGVLLYDLMAATRSNPLPRHRHLSRPRTLELAPALRDDDVAGGILYYDAQIDDARHTLAVARTAVAYGAEIATSVRVVDLLRDGDAVVGAAVEDLETGARLTISARQVVNATGVWNDDIHGMVRTAGLQVQAAKGVHLVIPGDRIDSKTGIIARTPTSVLFIIPWRNNWLLGTTDTAWDYDRDHPAASATDINYLLDQANRVLAEPLDRNDIIGVYAGLRPLLAGTAEETSQLSREHAVMRPAPGLVSIAGGKYTTYRIMAADAIDAAVEGLGGSPRTSRSDQLPLIGSQDWQTTWKQAGPGLARQWDLPVEVIEAMLHRHGSQIGAVLELLNDDDQLRTVLPGQHLAAEVVFAVRHEGALHLDDVLARRTHLSIETPDRGVASARIVADLMATELVWDADRIEQELGVWNDRVTAERDANTMVGDREASQRRTSVADIRDAASR
jgi:glycerol-3-phosphate dehydrogenase